MSDKPSKKTDEKKRDKVLERMLKTPPEPRKRPESDAKKPKKSSNK